MHISHYIGLKGAGGAELLFSELSNVWARRGLTQSALLRSAPIHREVARRLPDSLLTIDYKRWNGIRVPATPSFIRRTCLRQTMGQLPEPDIFLSWSNLRNNPALKKSSPYIHYEHGVGWIHKVDKEGQRFLNNAAGFICVSHAARRVLELKWGIENRSIAVVANPLRNSLTTKPEHHLPLEGRAIRLAFAGRLTAIKGLTITLHALALLRQGGINAELHVAGDGSQRTTLEQQADKLGISSSCHFHGFVADTRDFFSRMDIALFPSIRESFGMASLEASAAGCPVIASRIDGLPETIWEGHSGITLPCENDPRRYYDNNIMAQLPELVYDPDLDQLRTPGVVDPSRLADTIGMLANDTQRLNVMRRHAIEHAAHFNDLQQYGDQLFSHVCHIASATNRHGSNHHATSLP
ncbi:glycosyltransferase [Kushneria sp. TE3]|uniref:glycosyltransferase n=1 Tax=Kushneria sp. TE3 TaxID=3449832 RepID=UPI003F682EA4